MTRTPGGDQQPDHQLADQAEADDHAVSPSWSSARRTPCMAIGADGGEGGVLGRDAPRDRRAQVDRDPVVLGVQRVLVARRRDQLADLELLGALRPPRSPRRTASSPAACRSRAGS